MARPRNTPAASRLVEAAQADVADRLTVLVLDVMASEGVTKAELARRLGVSRPHVTQSLRGRNMTVGTAAEMLYRLGYALQLEAVPLRSA